MCGIIGLLSRQPLEQLQLEKTLKYLNHRGSDSSGLWNDHHIELGHTRLAILDLSPLGHQPMSYQNGRFWITFNGEIYNYLEIRQELMILGHSFASQGDTEVLIAAYAQWGQRCLDKLRGMFAFAIWDSSLNQLFLARDRTGEKPLYYWSDEHRFYFASELKALLQLLPHTPPLDPIAVDLYLHYQYVPEPRTPLKGVYKLPAAHCAVIDCEHWQLEPFCYWDIGHVQPREGEASKLIRQELDQVIELTLRADVSVGIALSGGLDSGAIAALATPRYKDTLQALSVGYEGRPPCDERTEAAELAQWLGLPFHDIELRTNDLVDFFPELVQALDEPIADIAAYGLFAVNRLAADLGIKVLLNGLGGDELFWGYAWVAEAVRLTEQKLSWRAQYGAYPTALAGLEWLSQLPPYERLANNLKLPGFLRSSLQQGLDVSCAAPHRPGQLAFYNVRGDFKSAWCHRNRLYTQSFLNQLPGRNPYAPFTMAIDEENIPNQICELLFDTWLVSNCLTLGDRTSMASGVEVRIPLLDYKLIELVIGLRQHQSDYQHGHKYWLKSALKGVLPEQVINRQKRGFEPPYGDWIGALVETYGSWVTTGYLVELGFFRGEYVEKLFKHYRHHYGLVYKLIILEVWYRTVIQDKASLA